MARCVEKLPHDKCGSSDALQVFESEKNKYTGYCFNCDTFIPSPYGDRKQEEKASPPLSPEDVAEQLYDISKLPILERSDRALRQDTLDWFRIRTSVSEQDGVSPIVSYFPFHNDVGDITSYKAKLIPAKEMWTVGEFKGKRNLFGWFQAIATGARVLYITEGEEDACALYQALRDKQKGTKWEELSPAVISLRNGASGAAKELHSLISEIRHNFAELILCFDMDDPGRKAAEEVVKLIYSARVATLPCKDANECVIKGMSIALATAVLWKSSVPKNSRIVSATSLYAEAREPAQYGLSWPWPGMTELTRGIRPGETNYMGAGVKMGKSDVANTLAAHLIIVHDLKVFMAKPEEINKKTIKLVLGKVAGKQFHDPNKDFDFDAYDEAAKLVTDNLQLLDIYQHLGAETLLQDIKEAASHGCKAIFIDPITNLTNSVSSGEANTILQSFAQELAVISKDLELITFIFCHLKAPDSGPSHERGGEVLSHQFAGSRAMMRSCNYMIGIQGNKDPTLPIEERNIRQIIMLEDREFGSSGIVNLYWDHNNGMFTEYE